MDPHQGHPPYLIAERVLALLPFSGRYTCDHINPLIIRDESRSFASVR